MKRPEFVMGTITAILFGLVICYGDFSILFGCSEQPQTEVRSQPDPRFTSPHTYTVGNTRITPIQHMKLGWRVLGENPEVTDAERAQIGPEPEEETWRKLVLQMTKSDGDLLDIQLLRPLEWITLSGAESGATIQLDLPEMGAVGDAEILAVEPCSPIEPGEGNIVTGRFAHEAAEAIDLSIEGESKPIGVTANHPFWSVSRQQFIAAGDLYAGELVETRNGDTRRVISQLPRPGPEPVFNLEIFGEHVYRVGDSGILAHNSCADGTVDLYRSVGVRELDSIKKTGKFLPGGNSLEGRQFAYTLDEAIRYADEDVGKVAVIRVRVKKSAIKYLDFSNDIDPEIFVNGVITVQPDVQSRLFHSSISEIEHVF